MDLPTAVKTVMIQKYATFSGRSSRSEYWWFFLAAIVGAIVTSLLGPLYLVYTLALICPTLAVGFRRLQDTGRQGWLIVIPFGLQLVTTFLAPDIPDEAAIAAGAEVDLSNIGVFAVLGLAQFIVALLFLWWLTRPSDPETNAYGPPPAA